MTKHDSPDREIIEIDTRYAAERWRYICPKGHIDWRPQSNGFYCKACAKSNRAGYFPVLIDRRSAEKIPRDRVRVSKTAVAAEYDTQEEIPTDGRDYSEFSTSTRSES